MSEFKFDEEKPYLWTAVRSNDALDGGYSCTVEEAEQNRMEGDKAFDVIESFTEETTDSQGDSGDYFPRFSERKIIEWLKKLGEPVEEGDVWYYQTGFIHAITLRKEYLIEGIRLIRNKYLKLKPFRYVYALYETAYMDDGIFLGADDFKQRLTEAQNIPQEIKDVIYTCYDMCRNSRKGFTDDDFKNVIINIIRQEKYKKFDDEVTLAVERRSKGFIEEADQHLMNYIHSFRDVEKNNKPVSIAKESAFAMDNYYANSHYHFETFSPRLNKLTGGGWKGETWIVGGYTGDGKTQMAKELVYEPMKAGDHILFISLEMLKEEMNSIFQARIACEMGYQELTLRKIRRRMLDETEIKKYRKVTEKMRTFDNLFIYQPEGKFTMDDLEMEIDRMNSFLNLDIVVIDYLELIDPDKRYESHRVRVKEVMRRAKRLATQKNLWVIIPHQISRQGRERAEKRSDPFYMMRDLQESSGVEQNCVVMTWIFQNDYYRERNRAKMGLAKNRMGRLDTLGWEIGTDWTHCRIFEDGFRVTNDILERKDSDLVDLE